MSRIRLALQGSVTLVEAHNRTSEPMASTSRSEPLGARPRSAVPSRLTTIIESRRPIWVVLRGCFDRLNPSINSAFRENGVSEAAREVIFNESNLIEALEEAWIGSGWPKIIPYQAGEGRSSGAGEP